MFRACRFSCGPAGVVQAVQAEGKVGAPIHGKCPDGAPDQFEEHVMQILGSYR
jgi:hypothetical protein